MKPDLPEVTEARRALHCLYIAVEQPVATDVEKRIEAAFTALARVSDKPYSDLLIIHKRLLAQLKATHDLLSAALPYEFWQIGEETQALRRAYEDVWLEEPKA